MHARFRRSLKCAAATTALAVAAVALSAALCAPVTRAAGASDSCPSPRIDTFDTVVHGRSQPSDANDPGVYSWLDLASSGGGLDGALWNDDPKRDQVEYIDSGIASQHSVHRSNVPNWHAPPASPPVSSVDYIAYPEITAADDGNGGYTYVPDVVVKDAFDFSAVASSAGPAYTDSNESWDRLHALGDSVLPMVDKVREYQRKLRDSGHEVAIRANRPDVQPAKTRLKEGRSTTVKVRLTDCDGAPLKGWKVHLTATHGKVSPAGLKTDGNGTAKTKFTARSKGLAMIRASVGPYQQVTHTTFGRFFGQGFVQVDQAKRLYSVHFTAQEAVHGDYSTTTDIGRRVDVAKDESGSADVVQVIESSDPKRGWKVIDSTADDRESASWYLDRRDSVQGCESEGERWNGSGTHHESGSGFGGPPIGPFGAGSGIEQYTSWASGDDCYNTNDSSQSQVDNGPHQDCPNDHWSWSGTRIRGYRVTLNESCTPDDKDTGTAQVRLSGRITITPIGFSH
jgi:hypothetical protein